MVNFVKTALILGLASTIIAHPGHEEEEYARAVSQRDLTARNALRLRACASKMKERGITDRAVARRNEKAKAARARAAKKRGVSLNGPFLGRRDTTSVLNTDHEGDVDAAAAEADESLIFDSTSSVVLNPEGEVGPFYVLGELVREDLTEDEPGVPLQIEAQFIDVSTCDPIQGLYWDVWNCNSTGVYSGVQSNGNGNSNDASNLDNTALRGIAETDEEGVATFQTIFPGHYSGRTTHIHIVAHLNATVLANDTLSSGYVPHIGQFFFDQDLITEVEATSPYSTNTVALTTNAEDRVFGEQETEGTTSDPVFNYVYVGDDVTDGLFAWIVVGIDTSASYTPTYSFEYTADGGEAVSSSSTGGGSGGGAPGGGGPGGF